MSAEAGVLGPPFIRYNDFVGKIGYLDELENKYKLGFGIKTTETERLFIKANELINMPDLKEEWQIRKAKMLKDKINVTKFMFWFFENYPESVKIMRKNPEYQLKFKSDCEL